MARLFLCLLCVAALAGQPAPCGADGLGEAEQSLLTQVHEMMTANADLLQTWRGESVVTRETRRAGDLPEGVEAVSRREARVAFLVDAVAGRSRSLTTKPGRATVGPDGGRAGPAERVIRGELLTEEGLFVFETPQAAGAAGARRVERRPRVDLDRHDEGFFSARGLFLSCNGTDLRSILLSLVNADAELKVAPRVSRDAERVALEWTHGASRNRYVFDLAAAGNLVEYMAATEIPGRPPRTRRVAIEYGREGGVVVPRLITEAYQAGAGAVQVYVVEKTEVRTQELGAAVEDSEFSLEEMGVQPGARIVDQASGKTTRYTPTTQP